MRALLRVARDAKWFRYVLGLLVICGFLHSTARAEVNVDAQVSVTRSGLVFNRASQTFDQTISITNHGATAIPSPLSFVVTNISASGVRLANAAGVSPGGHPYVAVPLAGNALVSGSTVSNVIVKFANPARVAFSYSFLVTGGQEQQALTGIMLPGASSDLAVARMPDFAGNGISMEELSDDQGVSFARTRLIVWYRNTATVGEVNALLASINGGIIDSLVGGPIVEVQIPDPGSLPALDAIIARVRTSPIFEQADRSVATLPEVTSFSGNHLAVKAPAAWNVLPAAVLAKSQKPVLLLVDHMRNGLPRPELFNVSVLRPDEIRNLTNDYRFLRAPTESVHGYQVLSVIAGNPSGLTQLSPLGRSRLASFQP